jgi:hypothetical protein
MLLAVLYSLSVAVGRPCRCLRRPPSLSSHFSSHHSRPPLRGQHDLRVTIRSRFRQVMSPPPSYTREDQKSVCKALGATLVTHRLTDTTLRLRGGCPRLSFHLPRKKKSVCKAPGAALAPPSFQSNLAFSLPMLSTRSGFLRPSRENSPRAYFT